MSGCLELFLGLLTLNVKMYYGWVSDIKLNCVVESVCEANPFGVNEAV